MLAAEIWHWWLGVTLTIVGVALAAMLIGAYLTTVSAQKHPRGKQARHEDL
jgi:hypothetical protein